MIALLKEYTLGDGSKVYDVLIESCGVTLAAIPCHGKLEAECVLESIRHNSNVKVIQ